MKPHSILGLLLAFPFVHASTVAQEPAAEPQASLVLVNAVPGEENVFVSFDDQPIWPPGFAAGQSTAAVMFAAGNKRIKVECEGYAPKEASLELPAGANCALVLYPGDLVREGPDKGKRQLGVFVPAPHKAGAKGPDGVRWKIVLVGTDKPQQLEVNGKAVNLSPRKSLELPGGNSLTVHFEGESILGAAPDEPGEYWAVVYPGGEGLSAVLLTHSPFKVPSG